MERCATVEVGRPSRRRGECHRLIAVATKTVCQFAAKASERLELDFTVLHTQALTYENECLIPWCSHHWYQPQPPLPRSQYSPVPVISPGAPQAYTNSKISIANSRNVQIASKVEKQAESGKSWLSGSKSHAKRDGVKFGAR
jgi:hypothetical protein